MRERVGGVLEGGGVHDLRLGVLVEELGVLVHEGLVEGAERACLLEDDDVQWPADALFDHAVDPARGERGCCGEVPDPTVAFRVLAQRGQPRGDIGCVRVAVRQIDVAQTQHLSTGQGAGEHGSAEGRTDHSGADEVG
ncbi:hypothetical protein ACVW19_001361 [Streptomyces sp. TE5632]